MTVKNLRMKLKKKKVQQNKYEIIAKILNEIMFENSNKTKTWKSLQIFMNMSIESLNAVLASYIRFAKNQLSRISSHERVQNVTHETSLFNLIFIQRYIDYSFQNFRDQQQILNTIASVFASTQSYWNNDRRMKKNQEFVQHAHSHFNSFINESMIYNRDFHDYCCYKCDKLDHVLEKCKTFSKKWLSRFAKRALQNICQLDTVASKNKNDQYEIVQFEIMIKSNQTLQQSIQSFVNTSFNSAIKITNYRDETPFMNRQNSFTQSSNFNVMSEIQSYTYVYDSNKKSKKFRKSKIFAMQTSSKNLKKFNFNSVTMFSKTLHDDNIFRVFDIKFKRRRLYNVNEFSSFDEKKQLSKKSTKIFIRSKKKKTKRKKKIMKFILNMINKSKINVKNIFIYNNIILFALYLYQIFFYFRDETKRLIQAFKKFKKKSNSKINQKDEKETRQKNNASEVYNHTYKNELRCCWHKKKENTLNNKRISWHNNQWKNRFRRFCHTL